MAESQGGEGRETVLAMTKADCAASAPFHILPLSLHIFPDSFLVLQSSLLL